MPETDFEAPLLELQKRILELEGFPGDPAKEKELTSNFEKIFRPTISKQPGFVEVKLMKLRSVPVGKPSGSWNYRLLVSFQNEDQRLKWVAHDEHQRVWPTIEKTLKGAKFGAVLYDLV